MIVFHRSFLECSFLYGVPKTGTAKMAQAQSCGLHKWDFPVTLKQNDNSFRGLDFDRLRGVSLQDLNGILGLINADAPQE